MRRTWKLCHYFEKARQLHYATMGALGEAIPASNPQEGISIGIFSEYIGRKEGKMSGDDLRKIEREIEDRIKEEFFTDHANGYSQRDGMSPNLISLDWKGRQIAEGSWLMQRLHAFRLWADSWVSPINFLITLGVGFILREIYNWVITLIFHLSR